MSFVVDLDQLDQFVADMAAFDAAVEAQIMALDAEIDRLHGVWTGQAAAAHKARHDELMKGVADMRKGLADLRKAAQTAHGNYSGAVATNQSMFNKVG